jgi:hypothetical protein
MKICNELDLLLGFNSKFKTFFRSRAESTPVRTPDSEICNSQLDNCFRHLLGNGSFLDLRPYNSTILNGQILEDGGKLSDDLQSHS